MKIETTSDNGNSVSNVFAICDEILNIVSWPLGSVSVNWAVKQEVFSYVNFNIKHNCGIIQGVITWYLLFSKSKSKIKPYIEKFSIHQFNFIHSLSLILVALTHIYTWSAEHALHKLKLIRGLCG